MSCCGDREKGPPEKKQRWEYIELSDFRSTSCWNFIAYGWLWFMGAVGVAVYAVDTFTAVNLLIFDRWSSQVQPVIPFKYSKWIFAICIFISYALCFYEWVRAIRVIKRDGVAASYMDPIANSLQSMRSRGFKRFLVYTQLTKSKKGTDYVAFFVYFAFQSAVRVVLAEGPRQAVNAMTLYAVMQADLINGGATTDGHSHIQQFFINLGAIADKNYEQAAIYASMLFTLVIWVFSALCLICAGILYLVFLWHYIPQQDGRLRIYCRRKIDRRLEKIVAHTIEAAMEDEAKKREKAERKAELKRQKTGELPPPRPMGLNRAPTLPDLGDDSALKKYDAASPLNRQDTKSTVSTLPLYSARPDGLDRQPSLPDLAYDRPDMPSRSGTQASGWSNASFEAEAPLLPNAGFAGGDGRTPSPAPTYYSRKPSTTPSIPPMPMRMDTQGTYTSQRPFTPTSATSARPPPGQRFPIRSNTVFSFEEPQSAGSEVSPSDFTRARTPMGPPPPRTNTTDGFAPRPRRQDSDVSYFSRPVAAPTPPPATIPRRPTVDSVNPPFRGPTPAPPSANRAFTPTYAPSLPTPPPNSYEMTSQSPPPVATTKIYQPFNPNLHSASTATTPAAQDGARRNITVAGASTPGVYPMQPAQRSFTAPAPVDARAMSSYASILDDYAAPDETGAYGARGGNARAAPPSSRQYSPAPSGWGQGRF